MLHYIRVDIRHFYIITIIIDKEVRYIMYLNIDSKSYMLTESYNKPYMKLIKFLIFINHLLYIMNKQR